MARRLSRRDFIAGVLATGTLSAGATYFVPGGRALSNVTLRLKTGVDSTGARALLVSMWNEANPHTQVEVEEFPGSTAVQASEMTSRVESRSADILNLDVIHIPYFSQRGYIEPVPLADAVEFLPQALLSSVCSTKRAQATCAVSADTTPNGPYWAAPFSTDVGMIFERTSWNSPRNDQEISLTSLLDTQVSDRSGDFAGQLQAFSSNTTEAFVVNVLEHALSSNPNILKSNSGMPSNQVEEWRLALDPLVRARDRGRLTMCDGEYVTMTQFVERRLRYMRNWPGSYRLIQDPEEPGIAAEVRVRPMTSGILGGQGLSVVAGSPHVDRAHELIKFLTSNDAQRILASFGAASTKKAIYSDPDITTFIPHLTGIQSSIEKAGSRPAICKYVDFSNAVARHVGGLLQQGRPLTPQFVEEVSKAMEGGCAT